MANDYNIDFFGRVPIDPGFTSMVETEGSGSYVKMFEKSNLFPVFQHICDKVVDKVASNKTKSDE
jgi:hypothetical protein